MDEEVLDFREGNARVRIVTSRPSGRATDLYPLKPVQWRRATRLLNKHGEQRCLRLMDSRAEAAFERSDTPTCLAWRDLMVAVHSICAEAPRVGEGRH